MEKDPTIITRLAAAKENENARFRVFTKLMARGRANQLNRMAEAHGQAASAQMDCRTCAACCRDNWLPLGSAEIERLAARLSMTVDAFRSRYITRDESGEEAIDATPCPFLEGTLCSVYEDRPDCCRGYPYVGGDVPSRMLGIQERAGSCPIIYEMLEQTKREIGFLALQRKDITKPPDKSEAE